MPRLDVIPALRHRGIFPGEISLRLICAGNESLGIPLRPSGVYIGLQFEEWAHRTVDEIVSTTEGVTEIPEPVDGIDVAYLEHDGLFYPLEAHERKSFNQIESGVYILTHDEGEPFGIFLHGPSANPFDALNPTDVAMKLDGLAAFVGEEVANELGFCIAALIENFKPEVGDLQLFLRFSRMEDYNEMFLNLCELIAIEEGQPFNRQDKMHDFLDYWVDADEDFGITALLAQYAKFGPCHPGETQANYDAEATDFRRLVEAGYLAAELGLVFI